MGTSIPLMIYERDDFVLLPTFVCSYTLMIRQLLDTVLLSMTETSLSHLQHAATHLSTNHDNDNLARPCKFLCGKLGNFGVEGRVRAELFTL